MPVEGFDIFVKEKGILNVNIDNAYKVAGLDPEAAKEAEKKKDKSPKRRAEIASAREKMCELFYDIRTWCCIINRCKCRTKHAASPDNFCKVS